MRGDATLVAFSWRSRAEGLVFVDVHLVLAAPKQGFTIKWNDLRELMRRQIVLPVNYCRAMNEPLSWKRFSKV